MQLRTQALVGDVVAFDEEDLPELDASELEYIDEGEEEEYFSLDSPPALLLDAVGGEATPARDERPLPRVARKEALRRIH